jgi:hypothetical protein
LFDLDPPSFLLIFFYDVKDTFLLLLVAIVAFLCHGLFLGLDISIGVGDSVIHLSHLPPLLFALLVLNRKTTNPKSTLFTYCCTEVSSAERARKRE